MSYISGVVNTLVQFARNLISDLKSSRRFQVATVLWIPLVVTGAILTIRFGIISTITTKYHEFKTTFVQQDSIQFPNLELFSLNTPTTVSCQQFTGRHESSPFFYPGQCTDQPNARHSCTSFVFSKYSASWTADPWGNPILCNLTFPANPAQNDEMFLLTPGGWNSSSSWNQQNPVFIRPNQAIGLNFFQEIFYMGGQQRDNWQVELSYETSIFQDGSQPYNVTIVFRVPFAATMVNWMSDGLDSWLLLAMWGGGFFFFYVLFLMAFNIAKFFIVNDSRLIASTAEFYGPRVGNAQQQ